MLVLPLPAKTNKTLRNKKSPVILLVEMIEMKDGSMKRIKKKHEELKWISVTAASEVGCYQERRNGKEKRKKKKEMNPQDCLLICLPCFHVTMIGIKMLATPNIGKSYAAPDLTAFAISNSRSWQLVASYG